MEVAPSQLWDFVLGSYKTPLPWLSNGPWMCTDHVLVPGTWKVTLYGKDFCTLRWGHYPGSWELGLNIITSVLIRVGEQGEISGIRGEVSVTPEAKMECWGRKPRNASSHQHLEEARN